ncbi:MAG: PAS domain S-box protein [Bacteroidales bacterium]|nr:PAS domain S-box protein [Bacteroidales bacterium]
MKKYNLSVFYATREVCKIVKNAFQGQSKQCYALSSEISEKNIPEDFTQNIIAIELNDTFQFKIKDILESIEEHENSVCIIIESDNETIYQYSRNPVFHKNIIKFPFNEREFAMITELSLERQALKILQKKSQLFSEAVNQSANSIVITNPEGEIEFVNPAFEEITGYTFNEVLGQHTRILKSGEHNEEFYEKMWKIIKMGVKWEGELRNRKKNGDLFWEEVTISPIISDNGNIRNYMAIKNDITERKKSSEALSNSKKLLKEIIDQVPQFIYVRDLDGRYLLANEAFAKYRGKDPEDIIGFTEQELNPDKAEIDKMLEEDRLIFEEGKEVHREEKIYDLIEKRDRYFQYSKVPFQLPDSKHPALLAVWNCVTEQKTIEKELRDAREELLDAQKLGGFGNWIVDFEHKKAIWTEQVYHQYGLDPNGEPPYAKDFYDYVHPDDHQQILDAIEKARTEGFARYECRAIKPNKEITYVEATVKPIIKNDTVTGFFGTSFDITTRKTYEDEIIAARKEAIAAAKAKSDFLSVMSHEIRTPLNAIIVMADMLANEINDPVHKENVEILNFSARDLLSLVNDILDYSKIEAGKLELESIPIKTRDYFKNIVNTNLLKAQEKGIKIELDFDENVPDEIMGDPLRLGQILKNLISNAVKFTEKGGVTLIVKQISRDDETSRIHFGIKDTGIGIQADKIDSLFEVFTQASSETSRKYGGTGLGLAIVKSLLFMHNSRIVVESKPHEGSLFHFEIEFPYKKAAPAKIEPIPEKLDALSLKGYNIMLVEDNVMNIMVAKKIFEKWDCKLNIAEDGYIAMQKATRHDFDIILMDLQMPGIDGFETTKKLRKMSGYYSKVPIFALSAAAPEEVIEKVKESGMNEMITKPFNPRQLYSVIKSYLPEPRTVKHTAPAMVTDRQARSTEDDVNIQILVKLSTILRKDKSEKAITYMENVAKDQTEALESGGLVEIIETINSIIRINKSYINNKNILLREMMSDLKKSLDELKEKYEKSQ